MKFAIFLVGFLLIGSLPLRLPQIILLPNLYTIMSEDIVGGCNVKIYIRDNKKGTSIYSLRRTALTQMHNAGVSLRYIKEISRHKDLGTLQRYLEVSLEQKKQALSVIGW